MFRKAVLLSLLFPFMLCAQEAKKEEIQEKKDTTVPNITEPSVPVATAPVVEEDPKDASNPARKSVMSMLDGFKKMGESRQKYLDEKISYEQYMQKDRKLSEEVSTHIDFRDVCENSLKYDYDVKKKKFKKDHWAGKSEADKASFAKLFTQLIEEIVYPIANEYFGDLKMTHKVMESQKNTARIKTIVTNTKKRKNRDFIMEWYLHLEGNGSWTVYDVDVEGERWVTGFRSQFNDVIMKKSYKELINMMKKKLGEVKDDRAVKDKDDLAKAKKDKEAAAAAAAVPTPEAVKTEPVKEEVKK